MTWPARVAALMAAQVAAEVEKQTDKPVRPERPVMIEAAILQRVLETHVIPTAFGADSFGIPFGLEV